MRDRTFADFMAGAFACISVLGFYAVLRETESAQTQSKQRAARKWELPLRRHRYRSPENDCRHCVGTGSRADCHSAPCAVCNGTGLHPRDAGTVLRLTALWDGAT